MNDGYRQLAQFKYEANLLYSASILQGHHIAYHKTEEPPFTLSITSGDFEKAFSIIKDLQLDDSDVNPDSEGYIAGYEEWADKMYVTGYYTGGNIPVWMYGDKYAVWFGPVNIITGLFILFLPLFNHEKIDFIALLFGMTELVCGILLTIRGCKALRK